jgi:hypothetical protein
MNLALKGLLKGFPKLFEKLWFKFIVELIISGILFLTYYILRYLLPKKYRIKDKTIRDFYKKFALFLTNMPNKDDNLFSILNKSRGIFSEFHDVKMAEDVNLFMDNFAKTNDLELKFDSPFLDSVFPFLEVHATHKIAEEISSNKLLHEYSFDGVNKIYIAKSDAYLSIFKESNASHYFAVTKGYDYRKLINKLLEVNNNRLFITFQNERLTYQKLEHEQNEVDYVPDNLAFEALEKEIKLFKDRGVQRSYILFGPPGTGKTTFCLELSKKVSNSIVKIDSSVFVKLHEGVSKMIIENIQCSIILVDDIDRIKNEVDVAALLYSLESVKGFTNKPTLIATVNNITTLDRAIIRPGRFDDIIHFDVPNTAEREKFIRILLKKNESSISEADLQTFVKITDGMSQAYIKEYVYQYRNDNDIEVVTRKIEERKRIIGREKF